MFRATYFLGTMVLLCWSLPVAAQSDKWQRVYTAEEFLVDLKPATLTYQPGRVVRLQFRTIFYQPESLDQNSKYKTRLETIEFRADKRYRYYETTFLDSFGKKLTSYSSSQEWKTFKPGGVTNRLYDAAISLSPFGHWTVTTYHYADEKPNVNSVAREPAKLNGTDVVIGLDEAAVGAERCHSPSYESHSLADSDFFSKFGISLERLGVVAAQGDAVILKCQTNDWAPSQSLILPLPTGNVLLLWKGVFLELKKGRR